MIIFFAGADGKDFINILSTAGIDNVLMSYYHFDKKLDPASLPFKRIFLDSGGYSARVSGKSIDIKDYGRFLLKHAHKFYCYANLDLTRSEDTLANQEYLENLGLKPLPVYHYDEWIEGKFKIFLDYIKHYSYIAVGGMAGVNVSQFRLFKFLDWIFYHTRDKIKVHGFGISSKLLLSRYPFFSGDSTSWLSFSKFGNSAANSKDMSFVKAKIKHWRQNALEEASFRKKDEGYYTNLWRARGILWKS